MQSERKLLNIKKKADVTQRNSFFCREKEII